MGKVYTCKSVFILTCLKFQALLRMAFNINCYFFNSLIVTCGGNAI